MRFFSDATTRRLEGRARRLGMRVGIVKAPDNSSGVFFIINIDGKPLTHWLSMGWSREEAMDFLDQRRSVEV